MNKLEKINYIIDTLELLFPEVPIPLDHKDPYTLLIAVLLSAQSTDIGVNKVTPKLFLKADNNTTDFYIKDGSIVNAFKTLKIFEHTLPNNFLRIHKSYIVNIDFVSRINFGKLKCTIDSSSYKLPFTKTYINNIEFINNSLSGISVLSQN